MIWGVISSPPIPIFEVGPLRLSLHGVFAAVGFLVGAWLATRKVEERGLDSAAYQSALSWAIVGALIGARYLTVPAALLAGVPPLDALNPFGGNFSILGGFVGGIAAGLLRIRALGLPPLPILDASAPGLALGTVVGRIGDLAIVEHLGSPTRLPWGYGIRPGYDVAPQHDALECATPPPGQEFCGVYHHAALYDMVGAAILLWVLLRADRDLRLRDGQLFAMWAVWYGAQRFVLDALRYGSGDATVGPLTWNQVSGLVIAIVGVYLFRRFAVRSVAPRP